MFNFSGGSEGSSYREKRLGRFGTSFSTGPVDVRRPSPAAVGRAVRGHDQQQDVLLRDYDHEGLSKLFVRGVEVYVTGYKKNEREHAGQAERRWKLQRCLDTVIRRMVFTRHHHRRIRHGRCKYLSIAHHLFSFEPIHQSRSIFA